MCRFISFWHNPLHGDVAVSDLDSHSNTEKALKLNNKVWYEGHYTPDGEIELRVNPSMTLPENYEEHFKNRFPSFVSFFNWAIIETGHKEKWEGSLDLSGLTSAERQEIRKKYGV